MKELKKYFQIVVAVTFLPLLISCEWIVSEKRINLGKSANIFPEITWLMDDSGTFFDIELADDGSYTTILSPDIYTFRLYPFRKGLYIIEVFGGEFKDSYGYSLIRKEEDKFDFLEFNSVEALQRANIKYQDGSIGKKLISPSKKMLIAYFTSVLNGKWKNDEDLIVLSLVTQEDRTKAAYLSQERLTKKLVKKHEQELRDAIDEEKQKSKDNASSNQKARHQPNWIYSDESSQSKVKKHLLTPGTNSAGNPNAYMRVGCVSGGWSLDVFWGVPLNNIYPDSSLPVAAKVYAKFGNTELWEMGWNLAKSNFLSIPPGVQNTVGAEVDSLIFSLLGMDSISKRNKEMFNWNAEQFIERISAHAALQNNDTILKLSSRDVDNDNINLTFNLGGFNELAVQHFKGHCF